MAELATIARPYAEALNKAAGSAGSAFSEQLTALAQLAGDEGLRRFAGNPKVPSVQVFDLIAGVALQRGLVLDIKVAKDLSQVWLRGAVRFVFEGNLP